MMLIQMIKNYFFLFMQQISVSRGRFKAFDWSCHWWKLSKAQKSRPKHVSNCKILNILNQCMRHAVSIGLMMIKMRKLLTFEVKQISCHLRQIWSLWPKLPSMDGVKGWTYLRLIFYKIFSILSPHDIDLWNSVQCPYLCKIFLNLFSLLKQAQSVSFPPPMFCTDLIKMFIRLWLQPLFWWESCRWAAV